MRPGLWSLLASLRMPTRPSVSPAWVRDYWQALHPHSAGASYVNFMMKESQERIQAAYRDNYERLVRIKSTYVPENRFRVNQNITPSA